MTIAESLIILCTVIALGKILGRCKIFGISLGVTWILFVGIVFSHFGYILDGSLLHFMKEFGLILFVYSIGLQVGPSFFSSFRSGGVKLNALAIMVVLLGVASTAVISLVTGTDIATMVGVMSGAVTNTPGLGAAQTAYSDITSQDASGIALGYAIAYPLGVVGCILSFILLKSFYKESSSSVSPVKAVKPVREEVQKESGSSQESDRMVHKKILVSKRSVNGLTLGKLDFQKYLGADVLKIRRAGIEIAPKEDVILQMGDVVTVVGVEKSVSAVEKVLGNSMKRLDEPNLIAFFAGIALGCFIGSIPIHFPGIPQGVKLGLAGGPLVVSILISCFGPRMKVVTYTTTSANLMIREIGIAIFLACVGLEAGGGFVSTIANGGLVWVLYGAIITVLPILLCGLVGKFILKLDYSTLIGVLSGSCTNPPALAFAQEQDRNTDKAAVGYATVYPLTMFLRVLAAQLMILIMV